MALHVEIDATDGWFIGAKIVLPFIVYQDDGTTPQDITGFDLLFKLRRNADDDVLVEKATGDGILVSDAIHGAGEITILDTDTAGFAEGQYELGMMRSDDPITVLFFGEAVLNKASVP